MSFFRRKNADAVNEEAQKEESLITPSAGVTDAGAGTSTVGETAAQTQADQTPQSASQDVQKALEEQLEKELAQASGQAQQTEAEETEKAAEAETAAAEVSTAAEAEQAAEAAQAETEQAAEAAQAETEQPAEAAQAETEQPVEAAQTEQAAEAPQAVPVQPASPVNGENASESQVEEDVKPKKKHKALKICIGLAALLGVVYAGGVFIFQDRYLPGTEINGQDVTFKTVSEVNRDTTAMVAGRSIKLQLRDGVTETIPGTDIDLTYVSTDGMEELLANQNKWFWFKALVGQADYYSAKQNVTCDNAKLAAVVGALPEMQAENTVYPENAKMELTDEDRIVIIDEIDGNQLIGDAVVQAVLTQLEAGNYNVALDEMEGIYVEPELRASNEDLIAQVEDLNGFLSTYVILDFHDAVDNPLSLDGEEEADDGSIPAEVIEAESTEGEIAASLPEESGAESAAESGETSGASSAESAAESAASVSGAESAASGSAVESAASVSGAESAESSAEEVVEETPEPTEEEKIAAMLERAKEDENREVLDGSVTRDWLTYDEETSMYSLDEESLAEDVGEWVAEMAERRDEVEYTFEFDSTNNGTVTVNCSNYGPGYGKIISNANEAEEMTEQLLNHESSEREPVFNSTTTAEEKLGDTYIEVSLDEQHLWYYVDGELYMESDVVTGVRDNPKRRTPTGFFEVEYKERNRTLVGENNSYRTPVAYWMRFRDGGFGFHDATWQPYFGGERWVYGGSHGCINLPYSFAASLYENVSVGVPVVVYGTYY